MKVILPLRWMFLAGLAAWSVTLVAQEVKPPETEAEFEAAYQQRIAREHINGVYIPRDLADAFVQLNRLIDEDSRRKFRSVPEEEAARKLHFSLGRWITHNWGFFEGSRLSHYIRQLGVYHPEDMARLIIVSYHRYLNKKDLDIKGQLVHYQEKQEAEREQYIQQGTILYQEKRPVPEEKVKGLKKGSGF